MAPHRLLSLFYCFFFTPFSSMSVCLSLSIFFYSLTPLSQQSIKWRYFFFILYMLATRFVLLVPNLKNEWCMVCASLENEPFESYIKYTLINCSIGEDLFPRHLWSSYINEFHLVYYFR